MPKNRLRRESTPVYQGREHHPSWSHHRRLWIKRYRYSKNQIKQMLLHSLETITSQNSHTHSQMVPKLRQSHWRILSQSLKRPSTTITTPRIRICSVCRCSAQGSLRLAPCTRPHTATRIHSLSQIQREMLCCKPSDSTHLETGLQGTQLYSRAMSRQLHHQEVHAVLRDPLSLTQSPHSMVALSTMQVGQSCQEEMSRSWQSTIWKIHLQVQVKKLQQVK